MLTTPNVISSHLPTYKEVQSKIPKPPSPVKNWPYVGKILTISKRVFQIAKFHVSKLQGHAGGIAVPLRRTVNVLGLGNPIGIYLGVKDLPGQATAVAAAVSHSDKAAATLGSFGMVLSAGDILDMVGTFVNSSLELIEAPTSAFFNTIGLPLGFFLTTANAALKIEKIAEGKDLRKELKSRVEKYEDNPPTPGVFKEELAHFLRVHVGVIPKELDKVLDGLSDLGDKVSKPEIEKARTKALADLVACKKTAVSRKASPQVLKALENLQEILLSDESFDEARAKEVITVLKAISKSAQNTLKSHLIALVSSTLTFSALCLFAASVPTSAPFVLLGTAVAIKLGLIFAEARQSEIPEINLKSKNLVELQ